MTGAGFVNAHTHLYSGLAPFGMSAPAVPPADFVAILAQVWWKLDRALDAQPLRMSARWYAAEALHFGTVGLVDHHESPNQDEGSIDILADACQAAGLPAVLCDGATERNGGRDEARRGLAEHSALLVKSEKHGDGPAAVARRPQAGDALQAERFDGQVPVAAAAGTAQQIDLDALRAQATAEAHRLWTRMAQL